MGAVEGDVTAILGKSLQDVRKQSEEIDAGFSMIAAENDELARSWG